MKLVLIRHGESEWNKLNLFTGWTDVELSEKGVEEAKEASRQLKEAGFDFDLCYTSYLKRAIHTLNEVLLGLDREWLPVKKSWKLNERHYGALQGLNKSETAAKYGEEQVKIWRRSYAVMPPALEEGDERNPRTQEQYREVEDKNELPLTESLKETVARVVPYFESEIKPQMQAGKRIVIAYLSIGEAEDYRFYWNKKWNKKKPNWIVKENENWEGNYIVKYWSPEWKNIIKKYQKKLDEIGVDGYLLDTVDTYQYFEENYKKTLE